MYEKVSLKKYTISQQIDSLFRFIEKTVWIRTWQSQLFLKYLSDAVFSHIKCSNKEGKCGKKPHKAWESCSSLWKHYISIAKYCNKKANIGWVQ